MASLMMQIGWPGCWWRLTPIFLKMESVMLFAGSPLMTSSRETDPEETGAMHLRVVVASPSLKSRRGDVNDTARLLEKRVLGVKRQRLRTLDLIIVILNKNANNWRINVT